MEDESPFTESPPLARSFAASPFANDPTSGDDAAPNITRDPPPSQPSVSAPQPPQQEGQSHSEGADDATRNAESPPDCTLVLIFLALACEHAVELGRKDVGRALEVVRWLLGGGDGSGES